MRRISFCCGNDVERQTNSWCKRAGASATLLVFLLARAACADGLQAGQWKTVQSPEIDGVVGPVQVTMLCLTQEAVLDLEKTFSPISRTTNSTCERTEHELTPQRLNWRLQCTGQSIWTWPENSSSSLPSITRRPSLRVRPCWANSCRACEHRSTHSGLAIAPETYAAASVGGLHSRGYVKSKTQLGQKPRRS